MYSKCTIHGSYGKQSDTGLTDSQKGAMKGGKWYPKYPKCEKTGHAECG